MTELDQSKILLLCLDNQPSIHGKYKDLLAIISRSVELKRARSIDEAREFFDEKPRAVLVADAGVTRSENVRVFSKLLSYLITGGLVIFGFDFPSLTPNDAFNVFWGKFELPWKSGNADRLSFRVNPFCSLPRGVRYNSLPSPYTMSVLHMRRAKPDDRMFLQAPDPEAETEDTLFPTGPHKGQAAVVGAKVKYGFLVYIGDINGQTGTKKLILALIGLRPRRTNTGRT
ncbi:hypothetical protein WAI453_011115 [Rhynchosporium graminicola]|uniref:Uncharacterized protein n=1 Tax=Rhynchosporium graminicola TaxID=2792576 RepID=A0A1E1L0P7_9HELO|nr:uncharacterized protein RCO7_05670 [Rhynchosporium commune]